MGRSSRRKRNRLRQSYSPEHDEPIEYERSSKLIFAVCCWLILIMTASCWEVFLDGMWMSITSLTWWAITLPSVGLAFLTIVGLLDLSRYRINLDENKIWKQCWFGSIEYHAKDIDYSKSNISMAWLTLFPKNKKQRNHWIRVYLLTYIYR